jgi:hypothetical protein
MSIIRSADNRNGNQGIPATSLPSREEEIADHPTGSSSNDV